MAYNRKRGKITNDQVTTQPLSQNIEMIENPKDEKEKLKPIANIDVSKTRIPEISSTTSTSDN